jgi:6-pyruvoyltetrahydropterin/6-carboxytetrahydropterin synthase
MYRVKIIKNFSSAHNLRGYEGNCEKLHGHNWKVEAALKGDKLDNVGMLVDFRVLKRALNAILDDLDHKYLNEHEAFTVINPTSENIAKYIFETLEVTFPNMVDSVTVWESDDAAATYSA